MAEYKMGMPSQKGNYNNTQGIGGTDGPVESTVKLDADGRPIMPGFEDLRDPAYGKETGLLYGDYLQQDPGGRVGLGLLQDEATRTGPSQWAQLQQGQQMGQLAQQGQGQLQQGMDNLSMRGGMREGSGERMALQNMRSQLTGGQNVRAGVADEDNSRQWQALGALPGAEMQDANYQGNINQFNINNAIKQQGIKQASTLEEYKEQMRGWAADKTADAQPAQNDGGFFTNLWESIF